MTRWVTLGLGLFDRLAKRTARVTGKHPGQALALVVEPLALFNALRGDTALLGCQRDARIEAIRAARITALREAVQHALERQALVAIEASEESALEPDEGSCGNPRPGRDMHSLPDARPVAFRYGRRRWHFSRGVRETCQRAA